LNERIFLLNEKKIVRSLVNVRAARGGDNPPLIITLPKNIANAFNLELGETLDILTDGEKIVLKRTEITKL
jgi:AbrB family looped-hinge helix DNA binding protein